MNDAARIDRLADSLATAYHATTDAAERARLVRQLAVVAAVARRYAAL